MLSVLMLAPLTNHLEHLRCKFDLHLALVNERSKLSHMFRDLGMIDRELNLEHEP